MKQEVRDKLSGAVEAFAKRNGSNGGLHRENSRHRSVDVPSSKDVVSTDDLGLICFVCTLFIAFGVPSPCVHLFKEKLLHCQSIAPIASWSPIFENEQVIY